jgi:cell wall-associated NlpC family hydrolase
MRTLLIATLALPLAMLPSARQDGAQASPARIVQLEAQLEKLNQQSDQLVEQYLQAKLALERTERTLSSLSHDADQAERALRDARQRLGARAAAAYIEGPGNDLAAVLGADDLGETIDRVQILDLLAQQDGDLMATLRIAGENYQARRAALEASQRQKARQVAGLASKKDQIDRTVDRTTQLLAQVKAADRARVLAAANHASSSPSPSGSGSGSGSGSSGGQQAPPPSAPASGAAATAVAFAKAQVGKPYQWGAAGPDAYDCSGLTMAAWAHAGVSLPHSSAAQYDATRRVSAGELQPGDLIFRYSPISHVSMYIGGGMQVSATHTGDYVRIQSASLSGITGYGRPAG